MPVTPKLSVFKTKRFWLRLAALMMICIMTFGSYFIYDTPAIYGRGLPCDCLDCKRDPICYDNSAFESPGKGTSDVWVQRYFAITKSNCHDPKLATCGCWEHETDCESRTQYGCTWRNTADERLAAALVDEFGNSTAKGPKYSCWSRTMPQTTATASVCMGDCWLDSVRGGMTWNAKYEPKFYVGVSEVNSGQRTGSQCFCGNTTKPLGTPTVKDCDTPCSGDHGQLCGAIDVSVVRSTECRVQTIQQAFAVDGQDYTNLKNLLLYSVYSFPNTVLCLFGGVLVDSIGLRRASIIFSLLICSGQVVFGIGTMLLQWPVMMVGRVLFGLGGESLTVAQSAFTARWFKDTKIMAIAFGITLSFTRIGSAVSFPVTPLLAKAYGVQAAAWLGLGAVLLSLTAIIVLGIIDRMAEKKGILGSATRAVDEPPFSVKQLSELPLAHWILTLLCMSFYVSILNFNGMALEFFVSKWKVDQITGADWTSIYTFVAAGASPLVGALVDTAGYSLVWMLLACCINCLIYALFIFTTVSPPVMMVMMGLSLTLISGTLWPLVALLVTNPRLHGTAYGMMTAIQNFGLATMPAIMGVILSKEYDGKSPQYKYYLVCWIFMGLSVFSGLLIHFAVVVVLLILDKPRYGGVMNSSSLKRKQLMKDHLLQSVAAIHGTASRGSIAFLKARDALSMPSGFDDDDIAETAPLLQSQE